MMKRPFAEVANPPAASGDLARRRIGEGFPLCPRLSGPIREADLAGFQPGKGALDGLRCPLSWPSWPRRAGRKGRSPEIALGGKTFLPRLSLACPNSLNGPESLADSVRSNR